MYCFKLVHLAVSLAGFVFMWLFFYVAHRDEVFHMVNFDYMIVTVYVFVLFLLLRTYNAYNIGYARISDNVAGQVIADFLSAAFIYGIGSISFGRFLNPLPLIGLCFAQTLWDILWSFAVKRIHNRIYKRKRTVVIYRNDDDLKRIEEIRYLERKFKIEKYIKNPPDDYPALEKRLKGFESIIVSGVNASLRNGLAKYCVEEDVHGYFAPHVGDIIMQGAEHINSFSVPIMSVRRFYKSPTYLVVKRVFDILLSLAAILVLSPVYLCVALAVKLYDRGPVLYKQVRLTKDGREFKILKFRSMKPNAEGDGVARLASENDDRITPVGKFIRACRLDELPQLFNILFGDMSIVGPRPERPEIAAQYVEELSAFSLRLQVKAGLTGYAQVYGKYNTSPYDKLQMDLMYVNKMSFYEDLRLMFATLRILFMPDRTEGVADGSTTAMGERAQETD